MTNLAAGLGEIGNPALHHIAVVVADLDEASERYRHLGFRNAERFVLEEQAVEVVTFRSGPGWIELICPTDREGPIARYLAKRGEGLHHVAFAVPDLAAALSRLDNSRVRLIDTSPRIGAHGWRIAFIHPESCGGVLTELVEA